MTDLEGAITHSVTAVHVHMVSALVARQIRNHQAHGSQYLEKYLI
jgi:hypothetical protein